jgi:hypothetical protein
VFKQAFLKGDSARRWDDFSKKRPRQVSLSYRIDGTFQDKTSLDRQKQIAYTSPT